MTETVSTCSIIASKLPSIMLCTQMYTLMHEQLAYMALRTKVLMHGAMGGFYVHAYFTV